MTNFKNWILKKEKTIILMRGVSGSGKTTLAKNIASDHGIVLSTDDYFLENGLYNFDAKKLGKYHKLNQKRTEEFMNIGFSPIIIDNTMLRAWEAKPYVLLADKYGYKVLIKEMTLISLEDLLKRQQERKNINKCLPKEYLEKSIKKFQRNITVDDIRKS